MTRDFEDMYELDDLSDAELRDLIREELAEYDTLDADNILVEVTNGEVVLAGRVGTETERRIADHVLTDVIGVTRFRNELFVDPIRRDEEPEAIDDHLGDAIARGEDQLGGTDRLQQDPASRHVHPDEERELYGTHDLESAIEDGEAWEAPDTPTPEGRYPSEPDTGPPDERR
ncbi:MAG TPA: BON domain-containing protein [Gemmatimonadaceae bacterium]